MAAPVPKSVTVEAEEWHPLRPTLPVVLGASTLISEPAWLHEYLWSYQPTNTPAEQIIKQSAVDAKVVRRQSAFSYTIERPGKINEGIYRVYQLKTRAIAEDTSIDGTLVNRKKWGLRLIVDFVIRPLFRVFYANEKQSLQLPLILDKRYSQKHVHWVYYGLLTEEQTRYGLAEWMRDVHGFYDNQQQDMWVTHPSLIAQVPQLQNATKRQADSLSVLQQFLNAQQSKDIVYQARDANSVQKRFGRYFATLDTSNAALALPYVKVASTEGQETLAYIRNTVLTNSSDPFDVLQDGKLPPLAAIRFVFEQHQRVYAETVNYLRGELNAVIDSVLAWLIEEGHQQLERNTVASPAVIRSDNTTVNAPSALNQWLLGQTSIWDDANRLRPAILQQENIKTMLREALLDTIDEKLIQWLRVPNVASGRQQYAFLNQQTTDIFMLGAIMDRFERLGFPQPYTAARAPVVKSGFQLAQRVLANETAALPPLYKSSHALLYYFFVKQPRNWNAMSRILSGTDTLELIMPYYYEQPVVVSRNAAPYKFTSLNAYQHQGLYVLRQLALDGSRWVDIAHMHVLVPRHERSVHVQAFRDDARNQIRLDAHMPSGLVHFGDADANRIKWFHSRSLALPEFVLDNSSNEEFTAATRDITTARQKNTKRWQLYPAIGLTVRMPIVLKGGTKPDEGHYGVFIVQKPVYHGAVQRVAYLAVHHVHVDEAYDKRVRLPLNGGMSLRLYSVLPVIRQYYSVATAAAKDGRPVVQWRLSRLDMGTQRLGDTGPELTRGGLDELDQGRYEALIQLENQPEVLQVVFDVTLNTVDRRTGRHFNVETQRFGEARWHSYRPDDPMLRRRPHKSAASVHVRSLAKLVALVDNGTVSFSDQLTLLLDEPTLTSDERVYVETLQQRLQELATIARRVNYTLPRISGVPRAISPTNSSRSERHVTLMNDAYSKWIERARQGELYVSDILSRFVNVLAQREQELLEHFFDVPQKLYAAHADMRGTLASRLPVMAAYDTGRIGGNVGPVVRNDPIRDYGFRRDLVTVFMGRSIVEYVARDSGRLADEEGAWTGFYSARTRDPVPYDWTYGFRMHGQTTFDDVVQSFLLSGRRGSVHVDTHHQHEREHEMIQVQKQLIAREFAQLWLALQQGGASRVPLSVIARFLEQTVRVEQRVQRVLSNEDLFTSLSSSSTTTTPSIGNNIIAEATEDKKKQQQLPIEMVERVLRRLERIVELQDAYNRDIVQRDPLDRKAARQAVVRFLGLKPRQVKHDAIENERFSDPERYVNEHPDPKKLNPDDRKKLERELARANQLLREAQAQIARADRQLSAGAFNVAQQDQQWRRQYPYAFRDNHPSEDARKSQLLAWKNEMDDHQKKIKQLEEELEEYKQSGVQTLLQTQNQENLEAQIAQFSVESKREFDEAKRSTLETERKVAQWHNTVAPQIERHKALRQRVVGLASDDVNRLKQLNEQQVQVLRQEFLNSFSPQFQEVLIQLDKSVVQQGRSLEELIKKLLNDMQAALVNQERSYVELKLDIDGWTLRQGGATLDDLDRKLTSTNRRTGELIQDTLAPSVTQGQQQLVALQQAIQLPEVRRLAFTQLASVLTPLRTQLTQRIVEKLAATRSSLVSAVQREKQKIDALDTSLFDVQERTAFSSALEQINQEWRRQAALLEQERVSQETRANTLTMLQEASDVKALVSAYLELKRTFLREWQRSANQLEKDTETLKVRFNEQTAALDQRIANARVAKVTREARRRTTAADTSAREQARRQQQYEKTRARVTAAAQALQRNHIAVLSATRTKIETLNMKQDADLNMIFNVALRDNVRANRQEILDLLDIMLSDLKKHKRALDDIATHALERFDVDIRADLRQLFTDPLNAEQRRIDNTLETIYGGGGGNDGTLKRLVENVVVARLIDGYYVRYTRNDDAIGYHRATAPLIESTETQRAVVDLVKDDIKQLTETASTQQLAYDAATRQMTRVTNNPLAPTAWQQVTALWVTRDTNAILADLQSNVRRAHIDRDALFERLRQAIETLRQRQQTTAPFDAIGVAQQWNVIVDLIVAYEQWIRQRAQPAQWSIFDVAKAQLYTAIGGATLEKHSAKQWAWQQVPSSLLNDTSNSVVQRYLNIKADTELDKAMLALLRQYQTDVAPTPLFTSISRGNAPIIEQAQTIIDATTLDAVQNVRVLLKGQLPQLSANATLGMSFIDVTWRYMLLNFPYDAASGDTGFLERVLNGRTKFMVWTHENNRLALWQRIGDDTWQAHNGDQMPQADMLRRVATQMVELPTNVSLLMEANVYDHFVKTALNDAATRKTSGDLVAAQLNQWDARVTLSVPFNTFETTWKTGKSRLEDRIKRAFGSVDQTPQELRTALNRYNAFIVPLEQHREQLKQVRAKPLLWFSLNDAQRQLCQLVSGVYTFEQATQARQSQLDNELQRVEALLQEEEQESDVSQLQETQKALLAKNQQRVPDVFSDKAALAAEEQRLQAALAALKEAREN